MTGQRPLFKIMIFRRIFCYNAHEVDNKKFRGIKCSCLRKRLHFLLPGRLCAEQGRKEDIYEK